MTDIVERLQMPVPHDECEDSWYSCPLSDGGCANDTAPHKCMCRAESLNAERAEAAAEIERLRSALRIAVNALRIAAERHTAHERIEAWLAEAEEYEKMEETTP